MQRLSSKMKNKSAYSPVHATERPTISSPVNNVSRSQIQLNTIPVKREILKPTRIPPVPDKASSTNRDVKAKPAQPLRPKTKNEVAKWWRQVEYERHAGLDDNFLPFEWFHGIHNNYLFLPVGFSGKITIFNWYKKCHLLQKLTLGILLVERSDTNNMRELIEAKK